MVGIPTSSGLYGKDLIVTQEGIGVAWDNAECGVGALRRGARSTLEQAFALESGQELRGARSGCVALSSRSVGASVR